MKRISIILGAFLAFALVDAVAPRVSARDAWISVRSKNFLLVGNAGEKEIRQVGMRLEQFREVFSYLAPTVNFSSPVPTTVLVFRSDSSFRPFKPNASTAGYFQAGQDVNYIALTTEVHGEQDPFKVIFHEYTHLLVNNTIGKVPVWFNEGLAEYYSTFTISSDQKVILGKPIESYLALLRQNKMLPLRTLFQIDQHSEFYHERDKQSVFYAESWALMHYLILGSEGQRLPQLGTFIKLLETRTPLEQAFQEAFKVSLENMEEELQQYLKRNSYAEVPAHFGRQLGRDKEMQTAPITEAEAYSYLGDLLLHTNRMDSEIYLRKALALDGSLALANDAMGMLRVQQGKTAEAREFLARALAADAENYLINYHHAYVLSREGMGPDRRVMGYDAESAAKMRAELKKAIELRPDFPESCKLLAFINLVTDTHLDESVALLQRVLQTSPGRSDLLFILAQLYLRKDDYQISRAILEQLAGEQSEAREAAQAMLGQVTVREEQMARFRATAGSAGEATPPRLVREDSEQNQGEVKTDPYAYLQDALRKRGEGEIQVQGVLTRIDCDPKSGITFVIKAGERLLKLRTDRFESVQITTFTPEVSGEITCGTRKSENVVVMCYLPIKGPRARVNGTAKSLEFVPKDFKLAPDPRAEKPAL